MEERGDHRDGKVLSPRRNVVCGKERHDVRMREACRQNGFIWSFHLLLQMETIFEAVPIKKNEEYEMIIFHFDFKDKKQLHDDFV